MTAPASEANSGVDRNGAEAIESDVGVPRVFISYSHRDRVFVDRLAADLPQRGVACWIDRSGLRPGDPDWDQSIRTAIRSCDGVVLVASMNSRLTVYVGGEIAVAKMYGRRIYAIWAAGDDWRDCVRIDMVQAQYIDGRGDNYPVAVDQLANTIVAEWSRPAGERRTAAAFESPDIEAPVGIRNPYKGLDAFQWEDAGDFFGRDSDVKLLVEQLRVAVGPSTEGSARMLAVVGPSGSGKSSTVMAGLLPALMRGAVPGSGTWIYLGERLESSGQRLVAPIVPGDRPLEALTLAIAAALPDRSIAGIREDLADDSCRGLHRFACALASRPSQRLVLVIDQFEELFTLTTNEQERQQFMHLLVAAVSDSRGPTVVVLTLRADFYYALASYPELWPIVQRRTHYLNGMSVDNLREVIETPAALPGVRLEFEKDLVGDMLFEVRAHEAALPLLEFTLEQLFNRRVGRTLTRHAYRELGGVLGTLGRHGDEVFAALPSDRHRSLARELFLRLLTVDSGEDKPTRRRLVGALVLATAKDTEAMREVAEAFIRARLLTAGSFGGQPTLEVSHEALAQAWARVRDWLREDSEGRRTRQALMERAREWADHDRDPGALYSGKLLKEAQDWCAASVPVLTQLEAEFLDASVALSADQAFRQERTHVVARRLTGASVAPLAAAVIVGAAAVYIDLRLYVAGASWIAALGALAVLLSLFAQAITGCVGLAVLWLLERRRVWQRGKTASLAAGAVGSLLAGAAVCVMFFATSNAVVPRLALSAAGMHVVPVFLAVMLWATFAACTFWTVGVFGLPAPWRYSGRRRWMLAVADLLGVSAVALAVVVPVLQFEVRDVPFREDFRDPARARLPISESTGRFDTRYDNGEYVIRNQVHQSPYFVWSPPVAPQVIYSDVDVRVMARLVAPTLWTYVGIGCRSSQPAEDSGYVFSVLPVRGVFQLSKKVNGTGSVLPSGSAASGVQSNAVTKGNGWNSLELNCSGSRITASLNGQQVASATDESFREGHVLLLVGVLPGAQNVPDEEGHFANLSVGSAAGGN